MPKFFHRLKIFTVLICLFGLILAVSGCPKKPAKRPFLGESPTIPNPTPTLARPNFQPLRDNIVNYINSKGYIRQGGKYSFYLYDLYSGSGLALNSITPIPGASTTKIPIALYLYNQAANGKLRLNDTMAYNKSTDYQTGAGAMQFFALNGLKYRYRALGNFLITLSDNVARNMLLRQLGVDNIANYMRSVGGQTVYPNGQNITTARDMVKYLRVTLDFQKKHPDLGNMFINDLSHTIWDNDGIPVNLPNTVQVAHKVGTITGVADDAGIVYLKGRPYVLSLLTQGFGQNIDEGFKVIGDISRMVYDFQNRLTKAE